MRTHTRRRARTSRRASLSMGRTFNSAKPLFHSCCGAVCSTYTLPDTCAHCMQHCRNVLHARMHTYARLHAHACVSTHTQPHTRLNTHTITPTHTLKHTHTRARAPRAHTVHTHTHARAHAARTPGGCAGSIRGRRPAASESSPSRAQLRRIEGATRPVAKPHLVGHPRPPARTHAQARLQPHCTGGKRQQAEQPVRDGSHASEGGAGMVCLVSTLVCLLNLACSAAPENYSPPRSISRVATARTISGMDGLPTTRA